ncbi:hypothetical protein chiPu_0027198, partial [Chiloscyllium punctatum]|nr:hypothetical protein [Chiloscyllium punctatum]
MIQDLLATLGLVQMAGAKKETLMKKEVPTEMKLRYAISLTRDSQGIYSLAMSPNGQELIVGFGNGAIQ